MWILRLSRNLILFAAMALLASAQRKITTPKEFLGFNIGDDYSVANYTQLDKYWHKIASECDRRKPVDIGPTEAGPRLPKYMMVITSPENPPRKLTIDGKSIAARLARAEGLTDDQAHALAKEGKAVVWIDGGLHASETVGSQQLMEMVYQMASRTDEETMRLLNDVIGLYVLANPDGQEMVANWYMREQDEKKRSLNGLPRLYAKYVGHDDNRDFYMSNMKESTNMNNQLFREWYPQIMYNHHQTGPAGAVIFMPPFRDPFNYNFDPLIPLGIEMVGTAMHSRLVAEGKGGSAMRTGANYSTWWNGGLLHRYVFPQYDWNFDRNHRKSDSDDHSARCAREAGCCKATGLALAHQTAGMALPPVDRVRIDEQSRHARPRFEVSRDVPVQHLPDGPELHLLKGQRGYLDSHAQADCGARRGSGKGCPTGRRTRRPGRRRRACGRGRRYTRWINARRIGRAHRSIRALCERAARP